MNELFRLIFVGIFTLGLTGGGIAIAQRLTFDTAGGDRACDLLLADMIAGPLDVASGTAQQMELSPTMCFYQMEGDGRFLVPETAAPGETITVTWTGTGDSADPRISLASKDQADFGWIAVFKIGEANSMELQMPDEPGLYEVRFLDIPAKEILGRVVVKVK